MVGVEGLGIRLMQAHAPTQKSIAVLGGGYAGMAAAVRLTQVGYRVTVFEAAATLGGRARRVVVQKNNQTIELDNGQHLLIGAYQHTLALLDFLRPYQQAALPFFHRSPLQLQMQSPTGTVLSLKTANLAAPWHLAVGLLRAKGLSWAERYALICAVRSLQKTAFNLGGDCSVALWLTQQKQSPRLVQIFWEPLVLATLNTPIAEASMQVFANVLRDGVCASAAASDFCYPAQDLSRLLPEPAALYIAEQGGQVRLNARVRQMQWQEGAWQLVTQTGQAAHFDAVICALPPHRLNDIDCDAPEWRELQADIAEYRYQPIYSVYVQFAPEARLPQPMVGLLGGLGQWVFDRGQITGQAGLWCVVISAEGAHQALSHEALSAQVLAQLAQCSYAHTPLWTQVIAEKRATFACTPQCYRPSFDIGLPHFALAGDYTHGDHPALILDGYVGPTTDAHPSTAYPATIEGAVRSGLVAANYVSDGF